MSSYHNVMCRCQKQKEMNAEKTKNVIPFTMKDVERKIIELRGQMVLIDRDVAELYGVETRRVNEAVRNNPDKFPTGYIMSLQQSEAQWVVENFDRLKAIKFSSNGTKAFTEKGLYMLATILKSPQATLTTINIIEAYSRLKDLGRTVSSIPRETDGAAKKSLSQKAGAILSGIVSKGLDVTEEELSVEVNLMAFKLSNTIKKTRKEE